MEATISPSVQVVGRIDEVKSAGDTVQDTVKEFYQAVNGLTSRHTH